MKKLRFLLFGCALLAASPASASLFSSDDDPVSPLQYSALLGLRQIDAELFRTKLMPLIDEAMRDGVITRGELEVIEKAAGNVAPQFYEAARAPSLQESFDQAVNKAGKAGRELGDRIGETFNEALDLFQDQLKQFRQGEEPPSGSTAL